MIQVDLHYGSGRYADYSVQATYTYIVNGYHLFSNQIRLWDPDLSWEGTAKSFAKAHPPHSSVDVYYDPRNPDNAVLIPGANELLCNGSLWAGSVVVILSTWLFMRYRKEYLQIAAQCREEAAKKSKVASTEKIEPVQSDMSARSFLSYEPAAKLKLNCFPDKECLLEVLGHESKKIQDWKPDDRVIDASGHVYRLVYRPENKWYDIEPTSETWDYQKILGFAVADVKLIKKDPKALRTRVDRAPDAKKIVVIMQCVDALSASSWFWIGLTVFLILFFLAVVFVGYHLVTWLQNRFLFLLF